jgi:hypothetical protein
VAYLSYLKHAWLWELEHARPMHRFEAPTQGGEIVSDRSAA